MTDEIVANDNNNIEYSICDYNRDKYKPSIPHLLTRDEIVLTGTDDFIAKSCSNQFSYVNSHYTEEKSSSCIKQTSTHNHPILTETAILVADSCSNRFECITCAYNTNKHSSYVKHLATRKHEKLTNATDISVSNIYRCDCGKEYKHRQTLFNHKKKCSLLKCDDNAPESAPESAPDKELVTILLKQNNMFQDLILKNEEEKKRITYEK